VRAARAAVQRAIAAKHDALVRTLTPMLQELEQQEQPRGKAGSLP
jgi:hypothetical protein